MTSHPGYNSYDFANPVTDRELFSGRESELKDIKYYLDQAANAPRAISLALIGNRASGKTSLLNIASQDAELRNFCTVRIDLDESDVDNSLAFFSKFFHAILFKACSRGAFGGLEGKTYDAYLDMITTYEVPADKTFCPFLFPIQYAKAAGANQTSSSMLDEGIKRDMGVVSYALKTPIVVLMDECDVLSLNRPILQKLRNIFMQASGYMLILAATPKLFPLLDEVFSPIIRQLKKISVQDFKKYKDSQRCIEGPIQKKGLDPSEVFDQETYLEIHELSGGRPYEINLICHVLFRRYQENPERAMSLSAAVLEDIRSELDKSQELSHRRVLQEIRGLSKSELTGLRFLCRCNGKLTLEQLISIEDIFYGDSRWTQQELEQLNGDLQSKHIIGTNEKQQLVFLGDEFERIYAKYFAKERGVNLHIDDLPSAMAWSLDEFDFFQRNGVSLKHFASMRRTPEREEIIDIVKKLGQMGGGDIFREHGWLASELCWVLMQHENAQYIEFLQLKVEFEWISNYSLFCFEQPPKSEVTNETSKLCKEIESSVVAQGGKLSWNVYKVAIPPRNSVVDAVLRSKEHYVKLYIADQHLEAAIDQYLKKRDKRSALWHAGLAHQFSDEHSFESSELNNLGYIFLGNDKVDAACDLFNEAIDLSSERSGLDRFLPRYNLAVARLIQGDISSANVMVREVVAGAANMTELKRELACLMLPQITEHDISLVEEWNPDLLEVSRRTLVTIESLLGTSH